MHRNVVLLLGLLIAGSCSTSLDSRVESQLRDENAGHRDRESDIELQVREIIAEQFGVSGTSFSLDESLTTQLGADDLDFVELTMTIEDRFSIAIPDEALVAPNEDSVPLSFSGMDFVDIVRGFATEN